VLPAFVAEMDLDLAGPIVEAVRDALAVGDCCYGHQGDLGEAFAAFGVRLYLLCSPHNPVGRVWSRQQLLTVAGICQSYGTLLLIDEIHAPLVLPGAEQVPFLSLDHEMTQRSVAFTSASKAWNIPGLKCGVAVVGSPELGAILGERCEASACPASPACPRPSRRSSGRWLDALLAQLDENRALLALLSPSACPA
jgi:cystathionine beta-lyase